MGLVDLRESAAYDLTIQIVGLPNTEPQGEKAIFEPKYKIAPDSLIVVRAYGEGIIDVILVGVESLVIAVCVEVGDSGVNGYSVLPAVDGQILV